MPASETGSAVVASLAIEPEAPATKGTAQAARCNLLLEHVILLVTPCCRYEDADEYQVLVRAHVPSMRRWCRPTGHLVPKLADIPPREYRQRLAEAAPPFGAGARR